MAVIHSEVPSIHRPERRNFWFAVSSVGLFISTVWMFYADYHREWKDYQRQFRAIEISKAQEEIARLEAQYQSNAEYVDFQQQLAAAQTDLQSRQAEMDQAQALLDEVAHRVFISETEWKVSKSVLDAAKYEYEEARETNRGLPHAEEHYNESNSRLQAAILDLEIVRKEQESAQAAAKLLTASADGLRQEISAITESKSRLESKVANLGPSLINAIRDRPVLDFLNPSIKVKQVQLHNLLNDVNFLKIGRVDRCQTCHLAITEPGYEEQPQPFKTHSNLDLIAGANSTHPYGEFGCTTCHEGLDRATYFVSAQHTPGSHHQAEEWEKNHGWEESHHWDNPMFPTEHTEASCLKCHRGEARIPGAPRLNKALDMLERAGCYGCHKIQGFQDLRKSAPDLRRIAGKTTRAWAYEWVRNPSDYRPNTWMPKFFHLSNTSAPEDQARNEVEIDALVNFLFDKSGTFETPEPPRQGDAERGKTVVSEKGCLGCHRIGEKPESRGTYGRDFGPSLDRVGDKLTENWLYQWVKDPRKYFPDTYMPNLRLTDQEAADVAAYLIAQKSSQPGAIPDVNEPLLDEVTLEYLKARLTDGEAREKLASMATDEKRLFLGDKLVTRYGCSGCHLIPGYEKALPIGVELTTEGSKLITRLDFGFVDIEHTRQDWFFQKLKDPRIFDHGKVKSPQEKLKMPDFGFSDEEASTLVTLLLGLVKDEPRMETINTFDPREAAIEAGRRIVQRRNCRGCHIIEGTGGSIRDAIDDPGYYPPDLIGEGAKVQSDWLFSFIKEPTTIRPWLTVRMPSFHFDDDEAGRIGEYFAALDNALYPFESDPDESPSTTQLAKGERWFTALKCLQCHVVSDAAASGLSAADLAPNLTMAKDRLRRDWIIDWLKDPQVLQPGTRMPNFFYSDGDELLDDADGKIDSIRDYLMELGGQRSRRAHATRISSAHSNSGM